MPADGRGALAHQVPGGVTNAMQDGGHGRRRVVLVSPDHVGPSLAGPGVRYAELARSLSAWHHVSLLAPTPAARPDPAHAAPLEYDPARPGSLERLLSGAEVVIAPPLAPSLAVRIARSPARWVADLYNPEPFEGL